MSVDYIHFNFPGIENVHCAFQTRVYDVNHTSFSGGNISFSVGDDPDSVLCNRKELLKKTDLEGWCELTQVHGQQLIFEPQCTKLEDTSLPEADGMATSRSKCALLIKTADCQPVFVAHNSGQFVLALHVGWRGDRHLFAYTAVEAFCKHYNIRPEDCSAIRGPSLSPAKAQFIHFESEWGGYFYRYLNLRDSTMNLWKMTRDQLMQAGIHQRNIYGIDLCTYTNGDKFFSYRKNNKCGRQANMIWIS